MTVADARRLKPTANDVLLDKIRDEASPDYIARIPEATKAGVQNTLKALQTYRPQMNEFTDALVNKIALTDIKGKSWTNPLAEFKRGLLTGGDTVEEIMVGLVKAKTYDPARDELERELFGTAQIEVQSNYHRVNRRDRYKVTINQPLLANAFNTPMGLSSFASQIMAAPGKSDQWDEFILMCSLFGEYESNGGYFKVGVRDITNPDSATRAEDARDFLTKVRELVSILGFISTQYNAARMQTSADPDELVLFVTPRVKAVVDVEALAAAFNVDKMALANRIIPIPEDKIGIDGAQAILTTRDFFQVYDQLFETASQWNPASLQNNYWLHRWQLISASRFVPAILFTTKGGDEVIKVVEKVTAVSAITIKDREDAVPTEVARGENYSLFAEADGTETSVRWTLTGNTSLRTWVSPTGVLHVGGDEGATSITVRATSTWLDPDNLMRNGEYSEATYTVSGPAVLDPWPNADNPDTTADDAGHQVTGITIQGVAVSPTFAAGTYTYTADVPNLPVKKADVKVTADGIDSGDIQVSVTGNTVTVEAAGAPGDPVYTVTVS